MMTSLLLLFRYVHVYVSLRLREMTWQSQTTLDNFVGNPGSVTTDPVYIRRCICLTSIYTYVDMFVS